MRFDQFLLGALSEDAVKIEIGGGRNPHKKADGYLNVDILDAPEVDVRRDLDAPDLLLPWGDNAVSAVYSCHCLEHLRDPRPLMTELCRVCRVGAEVVARVPHWLHDCALIVGHRHVLSERWVRRWPGIGLGVAHGKALTLRSVHYEPEVELEELRPFFGEKLGMTDQQIMRFVPNASHEAWYIWEVAADAR